MDGVTYRGCATDFECDDSDKQMCRLCKEDNCNSVDLSRLNIGYGGNWQELPLNCYTCVGDECKDSSGLIKKCEGNIRQNCGTVFDKEGVAVERGCSNQIYESKYGSYCDQNPDNCQFCKSNGCNDATSQSDYVTCIYCDGRNNYDCIAKPDSINRTRSCAGGCLTGLYYRTNEPNSPMELSRGCLDDLDLDDREECLNGNMEYCTACEGERCNTEIMPEKRLKCQMCLDENCEDTAQTECTSYRKNDQCYVRYANGNVKNMGCASDLDTSFMLEHKRELYLCDSDNCNSFENIPWVISCRSCNSTSDPNCAMQPHRTENKVCHGLPNSECFTYVDDGMLTT